MQIAGMFKATLFIVYVNPKDKVGRKQALEALCQARKQIPITLMSEEKEGEGEFSINKDKDIIFILSDTPELDRYSFDPLHDGPQGMLIPQTFSDNCLEKYLPNIKKLDDLDIKEWLAIAATASTSFEVSLEDDQAAINKKQSDQRMFMRYQDTPEVKYATNNAALLNNSDSIV